MYMQSANDSTKTGVHFYLRVKKRTGSEITLILNELDMNKETRIKYILCKIKTPFTLF